jgi:hypothetical protein
VIDDMFRRYEERLSSPLPSLTSHEHATLGQRWRAYKRKRARRDPLIWVSARMLIDPDDPDVLAAVVALVAVAGEPWLVRGVLRASEGAAGLTRVGIQHFTDAGAEVTSTVWKAIPVSTIRSRALAWLEPQEIIADVLGEQGDWGIGEDRALWARRVSAEARKKPLTRGRSGYPPEHYRRIALRAVELHKEGERDVVRRVAAEEQRPYATVRHWIQRAREHGFLAKAAKQGRREFLPGPDLYPKEE